VWRATPRSPSTSLAPAHIPVSHYAKWADAYKQKPNRLTTSRSASGGGIKQIVSKTVDFGASDAPLKLEQLEKDGLFSSRW